MRIHQNTTNFDNNLSATENTTDKAFDVLDELLTGTGETKLHTETPAATTWTFNHNLNYLRPIVQVIDNTGKVIIPEEIEFITTSQLTVTFPTAVEGFATATVGGTSTIQPNTIGLGELTDQYKKVLTNATVITTQDLDWDAYSGFILTMTGATTFSDVDLPATPNETQISILMTGDFAATFPAYYKFRGDTYDGTVWNYLAIECKDNTGASEQVVCLITNLT